MSESTSTNEEQVSPEKLAKMASRIRNLLARAEDPRLEHEEERQAFFNKAEKLRRKYRIAEEHLIATDQFSADVIVSKVNISTWRSDFYQNHFGMWVHVARFAGVLSRISWEGDALVATVVGYGSDIQHAEALYQAAWLTMAARLEPKVDPNLSDAENVCVLRSAGIARNRIAQMMWGSSLGKEGHAAHARVGKLYAQACAERGEDPVVAGKGINKTVYRERYADGFQAQFASRLRLARDAADSVGGALVLPGREQRVKEAFWKQFPDEHPDARAKRQAEYDASRSADDSPAKVVKYRGPTKADHARREREYYSAAALAGQQAGRSAADRVEIARTSQKAQRLEEGQPEPKTSSGIALGN